MQVNKKEWTKEEAPFNHCWSKNPCLVFPGLYMRVRGPKLFLFILQVGEFNHAVGGAKSPWPIQNNNCWGCPKDFITWVNCDAAVLHLNCLIV